MRGLSVIDHIIFFLHTMAAIIGSLISSASHSDECLLVTHSIMALNFEKQYLEDCEWMLAGRVTE